MTDLRERIAAAIYGSPPAWEQFPWDDLTDSSRQVHLEQADAVIEALNLKITVDYMSADGQRRNWIVAGHCTMEGSDD